MLAPEEQITWNEITKIALLDAYPALTDPDSPALAGIESYPELIRMLNKFATNVGTNWDGTPTQLGKFEIGDENLEYSYYEKSSNTIYLHPDSFGRPKEHEVVTTLAHEVSHALSSNKLDFSSADNYAHSRSLGEAESIYNEFVALHKIYADEIEDGNEEYKNYETMSWFDNKSSEVSHDHYNKIFEAIYGFDPSINPAHAAEYARNYDPTEISERDKQNILEKLTEVNKVLVRSTLGTSGVRVTYDENDKWWWLIAFTDVAIDYMEAWGAFYSRTYLTNQRQSAIDAIEGSREYSEDIKVLVNQAHKQNQGNNYYGTDGNDIMRVEEGGSILGKDLAHNEVLWGGKGDDVLFGSTTKDILLGGDDNDTLWGLEGDDILAGNQGHDILYGGIGNDQLRGGSGHDRLYGGAGHDTYHFNLSDYSNRDNPAGVMPDIITDSGGDGSIIFYRTNPDGTIIAGSEITLGLGRRAQGAPPDTFISEQDPSRRIWYRFQPSPEDDSKGQLFIYYESVLITIITDVDKEAPPFGLTLENGHLPPADDKIRHFSDFENDKGRTITIADQSDPARVVSVDLSGDDQTDVVTGSNGTDLINLGDGNDFANGENGCDTIYGGEGHDLIIGGAFKQQPTDHDHLVGGQGKDLIHGGDGDDVIIAGENMFEDGNTDFAGDIVSGGQGNDRIYGSRDRDFLNGGAGQDYIDGGGGDDLILGDAAFQFVEYDYLVAVNGACGFYWINAMGAQDDPYQGQWARVYVFSDWSMRIEDVLGGGRQYSYGAVKNQAALWNLDERLDGDVSRWSDVIFGGSGDDMILGQAGDDIIDGGADDDILYGDGERQADGSIAENITDYLLNGCDLLYGGDGADILYGGAGSDLLYADVTFYDPNPAWVYGDGDQDWLYGGDGDDYLYGGTGGDVLIGGNGNDHLYAGACIDAPYNGNELQGGHDKDVLVSNRGQHQLLGGTGHDTYLYSSQLLLADANYLQDTVADHYNIFVPHFSDLNLDWSFVLDGHRITMANLTHERVGNYYTGKVGDQNFRIEIQGSNYLFYLTNVDGDRQGKAVHFFGGANQAGLMRDGGKAVRISSDYVASDSIRGTITADGPSLHGFIDDFDDYINAEDYRGLRRSMQGLTIETLGGHDRVIGSAYNDYIDGGDGHDYLAGFGGNDQIYGGAGDDYLLGLDGNDALDGGSGQDRLEGGEGDDVLAGGEGDDVMLGGSGNDSLDGGEGDDLLQGGEGNDIILGGAGADEIYGEAGDDEIHGGEGNDYLDGGAGNDRLEGGEGDDVYVYGRGYGHDTVLDNRGENGILFDALNRDDIELRPVYDSYTDEKEAYDLIIRIKSTGETLTIIDGIMAPGNAGRPHKNTVVQFGDNSLAWLEDLFDPTWDLPEINEVSSENQIIEGDGGNNTLKGGSGHDQIWGRHGADTIYGLAGDDFISGNKGNDILYGGSGHDTIYGDNSLVIPMGSGEPIYIAHGPDDPASSGYGYDTIYGGDGNDLLLGGYSGDTVYGGQGDDLIFGGYGFKTGYEWATPFDGDDRLYGEAGNDQIFGGRGDDRLYGGDGDDHLDGSVGGDYMEGGGGNDVYYVNDDSYTYRHRLTRFFPVLELGDVRPPLAWGGPLNHLMMRGGIWMG